MAQQDPVAMMAQLLQQMQVANQNTVQMMQQNQQAAEARDAAMRQALDQQRTETLQMIKVLSDSMEKVGSKDKSGVVDVKGVGKPEVLHGETKEQVKNKWPLLVVWLHHLVCVAIRAGRRNAEVGGFPQWSNQG